MELEASALGTWSSNVVAQVPRPNASQGLLAGSILRHQHWVRVWSPAPIRHVTIIVGVRHRSRCAFSPAHSQHISTPAPGPVLARPGIQPKLWEVRVKILVSGGRILAEGKPELLDGGDLLIDGPSIETLAPRGEIAVAHVDKTLDATGCLVVPGMINTHQHDWYLLGKGLGDGMVLEDWVQDCLFPLESELNNGDLRVASRLACLDMIRTGTTTSVNHLVSETGDEADDAILEPVLETGMRQYFAKAIRPNDVASEYERARAAYERWNGRGNGLVRVGFVLEATSHWIAAGTSTEKMIQGGHALAREFDTFVSSHIAGGTLSRERGYLRWVLQMGRTDLEFLQGLGVLDHRWILAHTIHPQGKDLDLIAESGSTVSHTPSSEASRGGGIAPIKRMVDNGVKVALGTDGPMVDLTNDMLEQVKLTRLLQNQVHGDPSALTPEQVVHMGTAAGAAALGAGDQLGCIAEGARADIAVFDISGVHTAINHRPLSTFVHAARGTDAKHVLVDGQILLENGEFTRFSADDVRELIAEAGSRGRSLAERAGKLLASPR
ncbi:amidohydrolase family protein [Pseudonocardia alaniniphila]